MVRNPKDIDMRADPEFVHVSVAKMFLHEHGFTDVEQGERYLSFRYGSSFCSSSIYKYDMVDSRSYRRILARKARLA